MRGIYSGCALINKRLAVRPHLRGKILRLTQKCNGLSRVPTYIAYKRPYPAALAPISSTKMAVPTLPDFSICFRSSGEPPPTKITLPVRSSIFRSRRVRKRSATKDSAPRSTSVWISLPYSVLQPVRMESMSVSSSSRSWSARILDSNRL